MRLRCPLTPLLSYRPTALVTDMRTLNGVAQMHGAVGDELGVGAWHTVTQQAVNEFADVTGDHQWIHVDVARAASGPYGTTIAHGYLTLALLPLLMSDVFEFTGFSLKINYGLDGVRFPAAVPVGSRVRATATLSTVEQTPKGLRVVVRAVIQIENREAPVCVADTVSLLVV